MGTSERRERHQASLRREILDAASQLFAEEGYHRVTMRRIAQRIEYSPTTLYLHFKDKNELLAAVCDETFSQLAATFERLGNASRAPLVYLREMLRTYVDFGLAHPAQYTVAFIVPGVDDGAAQGSSAAVFGVKSGRRAFEILRRGVRACVESGDIRTANADLTAQALLAAAHGVTSLLITMPGVPPVAKSALADHTIDTLIAGLRAPATALRSQPAARPSRGAFLD
jgi:AcrR family transcriptional regulator